IIGNFAVAVSNHTRVLAQPSPALVLAEDFILEELDRPKRFNRLLEFVATFRVHIKHSLNVANAGDQVFRRIVTEHASQRGIDAEEFSIRSTLKNSFDSVFENLPILVFGFNKGLFGSFLVGNVLRGTKEPTRPARIVVDEVSLTVDKTDLAI